MTKPSPNNTVGTTSKTMIPIKSPTPQKAPLKSISSKEPLAAVEEVPNDEMYDEMTHVGEDTSSLSGNGGGFQPSGVVQTETMSNQLTRSRPSSREEMGSPLMSESELQYLPAEDDFASRSSTPYRSDPAYPSDYLPGESLEEYLQRTGRARSLVARTPPPQVRSASLQDNSSAAENNSPSSSNSSRRVDESNNMSYSRSSASEIHDFAPSSPTPQPAYSPHGKLRVSSLTSRWDTHPVAPPPPTKDAYPKETRPSQDNQALLSELAQVREELHETQHAWLRGQEETDRYRIELEEAREEIHKVRMEAAGARRQLEVAAADRAVLEEQMDVYQRKLKEVLARSDEMERERADYEERVRNLVGRAGGTEDALRKQVEDLQDQLHALKAEDEEVRNQLFDLQNKEHAAAEERKMLLQVAEQVKMERDEACALLEEEKAKGFRNEADFRLFSRKIRTLQDTNTELRQEVEQLRVELRKYQYEAASAAPDNDSTFYKDRLEQALFDNESLRALIEEMKRENDSLKSGASSPQTHSQPHPRTLTTRASASNLSPQHESHVLHNRRSVPSLGGRPWTSPESSGPQFTLGRQQAWGPDNNERAAFQERMRRYEEETGSVSNTSNDRGSDVSSGVGPRSQWNSSNASPGSSGSYSRRDAGTLRRGMGMVGAVGSDGSKSANGREMLSGEEYMELRAKLNAELSRLQDEKAKLTSEMSRIPTSGGLGRVRRRREELEARLDDVDGKLGAVRMRMKEMGMF
ncbi:hypothetical protein HK104_011032 [Borealophlyctis nickersoniae]|nr:hypothetical protein HK104_011032 [Borealophlyctis nickersoniae]